MGIVYRNRFLVFRRLTQLAVLFFFVAGSTLGWTVLSGNLSTSRLLDTVTLTDPFALLQIFSTGTMVAAEALWGGLIVLLFFAIIAGRAFCSWICPVNMVTDFANRMRKKFGIGSAHRAWSISRTTRYWMLGLSLILSALLGVAAFEWISPISMLHRGIVFGMGMGWVAIVMVFFFDFSVVAHGFCGHLCPLGGFYSLVSRYSLVRVRHMKDRCTLCMKCIENCPERQVLPMVGEKTGLILSGECTNCAKCIDICDDRAMSFALRFAALSAQKDSNM